jgi:CheY-like chemotaxis protein
MGGSGLGLALVKKIVEEHSGRVEVSSKIGKGSQFRVYLPAVESEIQESAPDTNAIPEVGAGQYILLIENEAVLRDLLRSVLQEAGFQVLKAEDGASGLATFLKNRESISLIVTDLSVPYLGGRELIEIARKINPHVRTLLCTGNAGQDHEQDSALNPTTLLKKPFTSSEFLAAVTSILVTAK